MVPLGGRFIKSTNGTMQAQKNARKAVDTLGHLLALKVTAASAGDRDQVPHAKEPR